MILEGQITRVEEARSGVSTTGLPFCRRTIVVAYQEGSHDGTVLNQALAIDLTGEDAQRQYAQFQQIKIELRFNVSSYKGRLYQDVRGKVIVNAPQQQQASSVMQMSGFQQ